MGFALPPNNMDPAMVRLSANARGFFPLNGGFIKKASDLDALTRIQVRYVLQRTSYFYFVYILSCEYREIKA